MSPRRPDIPLRTTSRHTRDLSAPQLRALRKELLLVRASVERAELAEAAIELRTAVTRFSWVRFLVPALGLGFGRSPGGGAGLTAGLGNLLKQYPLLSSLASLVLAKPLRSGIVGAARPALKWGGLAFTAWEAYRVWQQIRRARETSPGASPRRGTADEAGRAE